MVLYLRERDIKMGKFNKTVLFICMFLMLAALFACNKQDGGNNTDNSEIAESTDGIGSNFEDEPDIEIIPTGTFEEEPDETTPEETTSAPSSDETFNYRVEESGVVIVGLAEGC